MSILLLSSMPLPTTAQIKACRSKVLAYYRKNKRLLPWRRTTDAYSILVAEIMLQQTQAARVIPYYRQWLRQWPTVQRLAKASPISVLKQWSGLGYNNRALRLHQTAQQITDEYDGDVIAAITNTKLPGIGPYTRAAVLIFSTNADTVTVDTNIRRIFMHEFKLQQPSEALLWEIATRCLPKGSSREWHNALMDYGALLLTAQKTGIPPKTKQSAFIGSDRQLRGSILRLVLRQGGLTVAQCCRHLSSDDVHRVRRVLDSMARDGLLVKQRAVYRIPE